jgi:uncharacterized repeat protein (TIGR03803 family)
MARTILPVICLAAFALALPARAQTFSTLYSFKGGTDATLPNAPLAIAGGMLFGTSEAGGATNNGTVFRVDAATGDERVVYSFGGGDDGGAPMGSVFLQDGVLYGTTTHGGSAQGGVAFAVDVTTGAERVLHSFSNRSGIIPEGGLTFRHGAGFGTTRFGGSSQLGTLDRIDLATGACTVLADLASVEGGSESSAAVTAHKGIVFGTTQGGGRSGFGLVFAVDAATRKETVLHSFHGNEGSYPTSGVVYVNGMLYGTTPAGGANGLGSIYRITVATGAYTLLYSLRAADGDNPVAALSLDHDVLYGETTEGGSGGGGTVFAYALANARERVLHSFSMSADGAAPIGGLTVQAHTLYGTTSTGSTYNAGTVFKLIP